LKSPTRATVTTAIEDGIMRFLITGGAGFIGSHLCERLVEKGHFVVCLDNFDSFYDPGIKRQNVQSLLSQKQFYLVEGDILRRSVLERVFGEGAFDVVVHLAARAGVRPSIEKPHLYQRVNIEGTVNLLEFSKRFCVPKFILASSSSVYGKNSKVPFSETDAVDCPVSPYAATKKACELLAFTYSSLYSFSVTCLRFFTVYGPRQRPDMAIHKFTRLIAEEQAIPLYGDGTSRRDYTYITDIIDGVERVIEMCDGYRIYNLGESRTITLNTLVRLIEKNLGMEAKIERFPDQPGDVPITFADISRAKDEIGYDPHVPVEAGIEAFVRWYKEINCI
jgi:UDP-glucuronate 4-epimerase